MGDVVSWEEGHGVWEFEDVEEGSACARGCEVEQVKEAVDVVVDDVGGGDDERRVEVHGGCNQSHPLDRKE